MILSAAAVCAVLADATRGTVREWLAIPRTWAELAAEYPGWYVWAVRRGLSVADPDESAHISAIEPWTALRFAGHRLSSADVHRCAAGEPIEALRSVPDRLDAGFLAQCVRAYPQDVLRLARHRLTAAQIAACEVADARSGRERQIIDTTHA